MKATPSIDFQTVDPTRESLVRFVAMLQKVYRNLAQAVNNQILHFNGVPSGNPLVADLAVDDLTGNLYIWFGGAWVLISGGSGGSGGPGVPGVDGLDADEPIMIPGAQGPQGNPGVTGPAGPMGLGVDGLDGEDGMMIPGPLGSSGVSASSYPWSVLVPSLTPSYLDLSGLTWVNQLTSTATQVDASHPLQWIGNNSTAANNVSALVQTYPTTPFTVTMGFAASTFIRSYNSFGFILRDSASGKLSLLGYFYNFPTGGFLFAERINYNSPTGFSASVAGVTVPTIGTYLMWLKLVDDGTNLTLSWSYDGTNYVTAYTGLHTDFLTPNQIGIGSDKGGFMWASVFYWKIA